MRAIIIGATGLVGNFILHEILGDSSFTEVRIFVRKPTGIINPKLKEFVSTMKDIDALSNDIQGDVLFNAIGTTIKQAGSKMEQQRIDRDLPIAFARIASGNGVKIMLNVSSVGANMKGGFYLKTKAEMEKGTEAFFHGRIFHFRPGMLTGDRKEFRPAEKIASVIVKVIDPLLAGSSKKYRSIAAGKLARAMVGVSRNPAGRSVILYYREIIKCI